MEEEPPVELGSMAAGQARQRGERLLDMAHTTTRARHTFSRKV